MTLGGKGQARLTTTDEGRQWQRRKHGRKRYDEGCRCDICRGAASSHMAEMARRRTARARAERAERLAALKVEAFQRPSRVQAILNDVFPPVEVVLARAMEYPTPRPPGRKRAAAAPPPAAQPARGHGPGGMPCMYEWPDDPERLCDKPVFGGHVMCPVHRA